MNEEVNDNEAIDSKKKQASEQVLSFYEVYTYHVMKIICGIIFVGVPLIYSLKIGRSGILSGVLNYKSSGYCSPFNKPSVSNAGKPYNKNSELNKYVQPESIPNNEGSYDNTIITDDISFYVSLQQCINDAFKSSSEEETPDSNDSVCKISYGKLIEFKYEDNVTNMLSSTNPFLNKWIQLQNWIQYTIMDPVPSLSDQVMTKWNYAKNGTDATIITYLLSISYLLFINFPLDVFRRLLVLAIVLYDFVFGYIINIFTYYTFIPYSFFEIVLLFLPSLLMLALPIPTFFNLFYYIFKSISYFFVLCFIVYYFFTIGIYIVYIAKSYSEAAKKVDIAFSIMKLFIYIGAIIIILVLIFQTPLLLPGLCIIVQLISIFIMLYISILPLTFKAVIKSGGDSGGKSSMDSGMDSGMESSGDSIGEPISKSSDDSIGEPISKSSDATISKSSDDSIGEPISKSIGDSRGGGSSSTKQYSFLSCIRGLKYKQSYILLLLLIVFIYDLFSCNVVSLSGGSLGTVFIFLIILLIFSYFNNTLLFKDTAKNGFLSSYAINSYKEEALQNSNMTEITKEMYKKYSKTTRVTYDCNASFSESTTVLPSYQYSSFSIGSAIMTRLREYIRR
jgi:hypothetical protein